MVEANSLKGFVKWLPGQSVRWYECFL